LSIAQKGARVPKRHRVGPWSPVISVELGPGHAAGDSQAGVSGASLTASECDRVTGGKLSVLAAVRRALDTGRRGHAFGQLVDREHLDPGRAGTLPVPSPQSTHRRASVPAAAQLRK